jgi:hypothetical protein
MPSQLLKCGNDLIPLTRPGGVVPSESQSKELAGPACFEQVSVEGYYSSVTEKASRCCLPVSDQPSIPFGSTASVPGPKRWFPFIKRNEQDRPYTRATLKRHAQ